MTDAQAIISAGLQAHFDAIEKRISGGEERLGFKVALNAPAAQKNIGIPYSLVAGLTKTTIRPNGDTMSLAGMTGPAVEAEVAVWLGADIAPDASVAEAAAAVSQWAPAIEVVDINRPFDQLQDILTEGVFHKAVIFGEPKAPAPGADLSGIQARATLGDESVADVDARTATGHAPEVLVHVAKLLDQAGQRLRAGDVVILGAMNPLTRPEPGQRFTVGLAGLGSVSVDFTG